MIDRFACVHIRTDDSKLHGAALKRLLVHDIQLHRQSMIAEFSPEHVTREDQRADAAVTPVAGVLTVVAHCTADLMRLVIASESRAGRHADGGIVFDAVLHHYIQYTGSKNTS